MEENVSVHEKLFTLFAEKPWFLDSIYWITTKICFEFPTLQTGEVTVYWDKESKIPLPVSPDSYIYEKEDPDSDGINIYIRISPHGGLKNLYIKVQFCRNFDKKAFCYFAKAICRFYNKINKTHLEMLGDIFDDTHEKSIKDVLTELNGKNIKAFYNEKTPYIMPRALRARYTFATNVAYFDYIVNGEIGQNSKRTFFRDILSYLEKRAFETYEGEHYPFACIIDTGKIATDEERENGIKILDYLKHKESNIFSNGYDTFFIVNQEGYIMEYITDPHKVKCTSLSDRVIFAPQQYYSVAKLCQGNLVGVILDERGEILVLKNQALVLSKLKGEWHYHDQAAITAAIKSKIISLGRNPSSADASSKNIYASILDVSFAHTGGCLGIIKPNTAIGDTVINTKTVIKTGKPLANDTITKFIMRTPNKKICFHHLNRQTRADLLALDGANILTPSSKYMAVGYILNETLSTPGGGGREAAARKLGELGLGIKISEDGEIKLFSKWQDLNDEVTFIKILS